ncbi:zinc-binding dehydrogenase [Amycolatopsis sp. WQ 127309]|uniref:zinc-binding dehydrogenase n=1 Tax=Amycolatopsis sp. WQ 127309 TaxID=2932773 RepID=UPI001FF63715|nr:zinc-binding dehydrogenase [Amycolatopsis sp. WQ 127309]UOZ05274.1 zinc-binding dehydrogenase [Amycolatopsis sp. WQ 127309]
MIGLVSREDKVPMAAGADHVPTLEALLRRTNEIFGFVRSGQLTPRIGKRCAPAGAARAHRDLESRRTTGKLLLVP